MHRHVSPWRVQRQHAFGPHFLQGILGLSHDKIVLRFVAKHGIDVGVPIVCLLLQQSMEAFAMQPHKRGRGIFVFFFFFFFFFLLFTFFVFYHLVKQQGSVPRLHEGPQPIAHRSFSFSFVLLSCLFWLPSIDHELFIWFASSEINAFFPLTPKLNQK